MFQLIRGGLPGFNRRLQGRLMPCSDLAVICSWPPCKIIFFSLHFIAFNIWFTVSKWSSCNSFCQSILQIFQNYVSNLYWILFSTLCSNKNCLCFKKKDLLVLFWLVEVLRTKNNILIGDFSWSYWIPINQYWSVTILWGWKELLS